ncbi:MAG: hypothetical protein ACD_66C00033G0001 [uncultured bacterium]|nr:MAG: hypothetical protein ACD_66C00033G0001 [uncultured bacterium]
MKQKQWKDCPVCGAKDSMRFKENFSERFKFKSCPSLIIEGLSGYFCKKCKDGIYTIETDNLIESKLAEHKARYDAKNTPVSEVIPVSTASKLLHMTRQGVLKLMKAGKLAYVFLDDKRFPKKQSVLDYGKLA